MSGRRPLRWAPDVLGHFAGAEIELRRFRRAREASRFELCLRHVLEMSVGLQHVWVNLGLKVSGGGGYIFDAG